MFNMKERKARKAAKAENEKKEAFAKIRRERLDKMEKRHAAHLSELETGRKMLEILREGYFRGNYAEARDEIGREPMDIVKALFVAVAIENAELKKRLEKLESGK